MPSELFPRSERLPEVQNSTSEFSRSLIRDLGLIYFETKLPTPPNGTIIRLLASKRYDMDFEAKFLTRYDYSTRDDY